MEALATRFEFGGLDMAQHETPYDHTCIPRMFGEPVAATLHRWFESQRDWLFRETSFYTQNSTEVYVGLEQRAKDLDLGFDLREYVVSLAEHVFGKAFRHDRFEAFAHMFEAGQGIGLHNDWPIGGTESHRIVVHFNPDYRDDQGGHLIMYASDEPAEVAAVYRPLHNMAIAFPLSLHSWHSVANVVSGRRYSMVFSLWEADASITSSDSDNWRPNWSILIDAGAKEIEHSGRSFFDHLVGVAKVLERWGCDRATIEAGLFHSVYGTESFRPKGLRRIDAEMLQAVIGRRAEGLVARYGERSLSALAEQRTSEDDTALVHIHWANVFEQALHVPIGDPELAVRRRDFQATRDCLSAKARDDLAAFLGLDAEAGR